MTTAAFLIVAALMVVSAIWAVTAKNILHAALALVAAFFGTAILYLGLESEFLAVAQVLVYIGGVVIFVVFTILLTSRLGEQAFLPQPVRVGLGLALSGALLAGSLFLLYRAEEAVEGAARVAPAAFGSLAAVGRKFLTLGADGMLVPFEIISILLLSAIIGAISVARKPEDDDR